MVATSVSQSVAPTHYDTIVLGAGIAGLACAARILQHSTYRHKQSSVLVLEARDRIGGRIGSVTVNGCRLDTGANWIHGVGTEEQRNPLMEVLPHKQYRELDGTVMFRAKGREGSESEAEDEGWVKVDGLAETTTPRPSTSNADLAIPSKDAGLLQSVLWGLIDELHEKGVDAPSEEARTTTMLTTITESKALRHAFAKLPEDLHETLSGLPQFVENIEAAPLTVQSAEHQQGRPGLALSEFAIDDFEGDQVFLRDGYTAVVDEVAKDLLAAGAVRLGEEVQQVSWDEDPVVVKTSSGTYTAKRVVCTLPLGVLKHFAGQGGSTSDASTLFSPTLPQEKTEAISSLGYGTLDKIFLVYSHSWWTEEPYLSIFKKSIVRQSDDNGNESDIPDSLMGFTTSLPGFSITANGAVEPGPRVLSVINLHALTGFPALSTFVSCSNATYIESLSDQDAGAIVHHSLTAWLGREPPKPSAVHVTRWAQDQYSRGSYSHMIAGLSETKHREEFQIPAGNGRLRFAGEHTSRNHFATAHGALLSGWREADAIVAESQGKSM